MDNMDSYAVGFAGGVAIGLAIGLPLSTEMVVKFSKNERDALKGGTVTEETQQQACSRIQQAIKDFTDNKTDVLVICPQDLRSKATPANDDVQAMRRQQRRAPKLG